MGLGAEMPDHFLDEFRGLPGRPGATAAREVCDEAHHLLKENV